VRTIKILFVSVHPTCGESYDRIRAASETSNALDPMNCKATCQSKTIRPVTPPTTAVPMREVGFLRLNQKKFQIVRGKCV